MFFSRLLAAKFLAANTLNLYEAILGQQEREDGQFTPFLGSPVECVCVCVYVCVRACVYVYVYVLYSNFREFKFSLDKVW